MIGLCSIDVLWPCIRLWFVLVTEPVEFLKQIRARIMPAHANGLHDVT